MKWLSSKTIITFSLTLSLLAMQIAHPGYANENKQKGLSSQKSNYSIYLVRHAEKDNSQRNPHLTEKGNRRAQKLAQYLVNKNITAVFSTNYNRTLQTATPIADLINVSIQLYDPSKLDSFATQLKSMKENILVVGHSNTTPELASKLSGVNVQPMSEQDYHRLLIVSFENDTIQFTEIDLDNM
ncbi:MAG: histidine phosphatase family protein [Gammaproteobacteria bacterium]|nr:histidine phosphatase family protein [Gammaproteobacteria bacterium]